MTVTGNSFTVADIDRAVDRVREALTRLHLLMDLYLGAIDKSKEDNSQAKSASN